MQRTKCPTPTSEGGPCRNHLPCLLHDPATAEARHLRAIELGKAGAAARRERSVEKAKAPCPLSTVAEIRSTLERMMSEVRNTRGQAVSRASAVAKLAGEAHELLKSDIERKAAALVEERKQLEVDREELERERREFETERARGAVQ